LLDQKKKNNDTATNFANLRDSNSTDRFNNFAYTSSEPWTSRQVEIIMPISCDGTKIQKEQIKKIL